MRVKKIISDGSTIYEVAARAVDKNEDQGLSEYA